MATAALTTQALVQEVRAQRRTLWVAVAGTFLVMLDFNAPLTTLVATANTLRASPTAQTWMLAGISLGLASALLVTGALGDDYGRRRLFVIGSIVLAVSTAVCAGAPSSAAFIGGRVLQGMSGAAIVACSLGLIGHAFPPGPHRRQATGAWGASLGAGIAIGPLLAAFISQLTSWRAVYVAEAVLALLLALSALRAEESRAAHVRKLDVFGSVILVVALSCLVAGLVQGRQGWTSSATLSLLIAGAVALVLFVTVERRQAEPLIDLVLFRQRVFIASTVGALTTGLAVIGLMSYLPSALQGGLDMSPVLSAVMLSLWSGPSAVVSLLARRLPHRWSARWQVAAGLGLCAVGIASFSGLSRTSSWLHILPGLLIAGIGSGVLNAALARMAVESVPSSRAGMGSGANNTARYLGSSAGVAVVVAVVSSSHTTSGGSDHASLLSGMNAACIIAAVMAVAGAVIVVVAGERCSG